MAVPQAAFRRLVRPLGLLALLTGAAALLPLLDGRLGPMLASSLERGLEAAIWLAAAFLLVRALDVLVWSRRRMPLPRLLTDLVAALVWIAVGLAIAARLLEMPVAGIVTTSGVAVAVLGFALRDMLASLFAGIALSVERPYRIGDWLELPDGTLGRVVELGWLTTRLLTQDGIEHVAPNAQLASRGFSNFHHDRPWRDQVAVVLGYEVAPARAERILLAAIAEARPGAPMGSLGAVRADVRIARCGEAGVEWHLRYWLTDAAERTDMRHRVQAAALRHLYKAGLAPAQRRLDLFHAPMPARALDQRTQLDGLLARSDLFGVLGSEELRPLAEAARRCHLPAGAVVVRQGSAGSSLFVVVEGVLDITLDAGAAGARWLRLVGPGDMFGEYSLLTGEPRSATVTARTESILFEITQADLDPILKRCPELADAMGAILAQRQADGRRAASAAAVPAAAPEGEHGLLQRIRAFFGLPGER
ncbi:MAG: mechanosensitive ion channel family protein [Geminicoccaceae bacterium]